MARFCALCLCLSLCCACSMPLEMGPDVFDAAVDRPVPADNAVDRSVMDGSPDAFDATTDAVSDVPFVRRHDTVRIQFLHGTIAAFGNYLIRTTYPPGFLDGSTSGWTMNHCVGGIVPAPSPAPATTDQCTLDLTAFVNGETVEFYPIYAAGPSPVCSCDAGGVCPAGYLTNRFTVYLDPSVATFTAGAGLDFPCVMAASGVNVNAGRFTIP